MTRTTTKQRPHDFEWEDALDSALESLRRHVLEEWELELVRSRVNNVLARDCVRDPAFAATPSSPQAVSPLRASIGRKGNMMPLDLPGADVAFDPSPWLGIGADEAFEELVATIPWRAREISIAGKRIMQPRLTSWHADDGAIYTYSGRTHHPKPWTPTLLTIRSAVEAIAEARFNSVLLNRYPNERASIGFHSDDEPELGDNPVIASVSFGAAREFRFRPKTGGRAIPIRLTHGSVLVMRGDTQKNWQHGIEKSRSPCGERINLTFRLTAIAAGSRQGHDSEAWRGAKQARAARSASPNLEGTTP